jgi:CRISPR-associated protein Cas2
MALNAVKSWLIAYDVADPKRLARVHRYLKSKAVPVQYSVFVTRASAVQIGAIRSALAKLIDLKTDDVRIYQVPDSPELVVLGTRALPDGIQLLEGKEPGSFVGFTSSPPGAKLSLQPTESSHKRPG